MIPDLDVYLGAPVNIQGANGYRRQAGKPSFNTAPAMAKRFRIIMWLPVNGTSSTPKRITGSIRISLPWARSNMKMSAAQRSSSGGNADRHRAGQLQLHHSAGRAIYGTVSITLWAADLKTTGSLASRLRLALPLPIIFSALPTPGGSAEPS